MKTSKLRVPAWTSTANPITINGRKLDAPGTPGTYLTITPAWRWCSPDNSAMLGPTWIYRHNQGPEIQEAPPVTVPTLSSCGKPPEALLERVPGQHLAFRTKDQSDNLGLIPLDKSWGRFAGAGSVCKGFSMTPVVAGWEQSSRKRSRKDDGT